MSKSDILTRLYQTIEARKDADPSTSYTAKLLEKGVGKCAQKMGEEAVETAIAAVSEGKKEVIAESADLLYHLMVLWAATDVTPDEVFEALKKREGQSGIAEKAARKK